MSEAGDDVMEQMVRRFAADAIRPLEIDVNHAIPKAVIDGLKELGLFGLTLPEEYGGSGLSAPQTCRIIAALAETDRSVATTVGLHLGLGTRGLVAFGSKAQHERWLPLLATGQTIAAFATTEPGAGSDLTAISTTAQEYETGRLRIAGSKIYVTNGGFASLVTITASTPLLGNARRGTSLLIIPAGEKGVVKGAEEHKLGLRGSSTITISLDDVEVVANDAVLGGPGEGQRHLSHVLCWGRLFLSAGCVGTARSALQLTHAHVRASKQFKKPLLAQEVVQHQLAAASTRLRAMTALVEESALAADEGNEPKLARLSTSAKVFCSDGAGFICDTALQLHGGAGFIEDTGLALRVRDARVTRIFEGANDVLTTHAGVMELTAPTASRPGQEALFNAVETARKTMQDSLGVKVFGRSALLHALGRAVICRDAAAAATSAAKSAGEQASAAALTAEAIALAALVPQLTALNASQLTDVLEGVL